MTKENQDMEALAADPKKASYEANTLRTNTGPLHAELVRLYNAIHEAVAEGDGETCRELAQRARALLKAFEETESHKAENSAWLTKKMWAGLHVALGEFEKALAFETEGFRFAQSEPDSPETAQAKARRMSVSASNIADELRRLGRAAEALPWAKLSVELWSSNTINHLVLALALYQAGLTSEADQVIEQLRRVAKFGDARDVLSKCMSYERELHGMDDLPSVRRLFEDMRAAQSASKEVQP